MNISYDAYRVFCAVASCGSVTAAAEQLYISQPAVSQSIRQMEDALSCTLFVREPKGVRLTEEGRLLYAYASEGIQKLAAGERNLAAMLRMDTGEIKIGASDMTLQYCLLPCLEQFHREFPKIKISITNNPTPQTMQALLMDEIDFALVSDPFPEHKGLKRIPIREIQDVLVCERSLFPGEYSLSELPSDSLILLERSTSTRKFLEREFEARGLTVEPKFELATSALIVQFALRGLGVGCVVRDFAEDLIAAGKIREIKLRDPLPPRHICLLRKSHVVSKASETLMKLVCP